MTQLKPYERPVIRLNVTSILPQYINSQSVQGIKSHYVHSIAEANLPGNPQMKYTIVDEDHLINGVGIQELSIRTLGQDELKDLKALPTTSSWYNPSTFVYKTQWPIDVEQYFSQTDWPLELDLWLTEGLGKDARLINCQKAITIPLRGNPLKIQPLNAHSIWLTNTGIGKSFYAYLIGTAPIQGATEAGAIGSYHQHDGKVIHGFLHGEGFPVLIDEINTSDKPLIHKLLTYSENGKVWRGLKIPIYAQGTKTIILTGNPANTDLGSSFARFITIVCTADEPERIGRRFGFLLLGDDYIRVKGDGNPSLRDEVRRVIHTTTLQYRHHIKSMMAAQMGWIMRQEPQIEREIQEYARTTPVQIAADFVMGQSYGCVKKIKTGAIRYIILEQLDRVPRKAVDFSDREEIFQKLLDINRDSWNKLVCIRPLGFSDKEWALDLKAKHPSLSLREIAKIIEVSHTTIKNWLNSEKQNQN